MQSSDSRGLDRRNNNNTIIFRRGDVRTIDLWRIEFLQDVPEGALIGRTPLLSRRGDYVDVRYGNGIGWSINTRTYNGEKERHTRLHKTFTKLKLSPEDRKEFIKDILSWTPAEILSNSRSLDLLSEWVTKKELQHWEKHGEITIQSSQYRQKQYVITKERLDRTQVIMDGRINHTLCVQSTENYDLPYGDALLSKIVALKSNEEYFINHSNRFDVTRSERQEYERRHPPPPPPPSPSHPATINRSTWSPPSIGVSGAQEQVLNTGPRIERIGLYGGIYQGFTQTDTRALEDAVQQYTQAQANLDGLNGNMNGLAVRDIAGETTPAATTPRSQQRQRQQQPVWDLGHLVNPANIERDGGEARLQLRARSEGIDIQRIGHISPLPFQTQINPFYINQCISYVVAQGLLDNISTVEEGLAIRSLLPDLDFLMYGINGTAIISREWEQPCTPLAFPENLLNGNSRFPIYGTNRDCNNDRKAILLYGIANLRRNTNLANSLIIQRSTVRVVDIIDLSYSALPNVSFIPFRQPIIFKCGDNMNLYLDLKPEAAGQRSHYMLLGMVAEAIGANLCG